MHVLGVSACFYAARLYLTNNRPVASQMACARVIAIVLQGFSSQCRDISYMYYLASTGLQSITSGTRNCGKAVAYCSDLCQGSNLISDH